MSPERWAVLEDFLREEGCSDEQIWRIKRVIQPPKLGSFLVESTRFGKHRGATAEAAAREHASVLEAHYETPSITVYERVARFTVVKPDWLGPEFDLRPT